MCGSQAGPESMFLPPHVFASQLSFSTTPSFESTFVSFDQANEALYLLDKPGMQEVVKEAAEAAYTSDEVVEIERILALSESELVKMQLKKAIELKVCCSGRL